MVRAFLVLVIVFVLLVAGAGLAIWWKFATLKQVLVADIGKSIGAEVQIDSIDFDAWKGELHLAGVSLTNQNAAAPWDKADVSQATLRFRPSDVFLSTMPVTMEISDWNVIFHSRVGTSDTSFTAALPESAPEESHGHIQITKISAHNGTAEIDFSPDRKVYFHAINFDSENNGGGVWTSQVELGSLEAGPLKTGPCSTEMRFEEDKIAFSALRMQVEPGLLTGEGEVELSGSHSAEVKLKAADIPVAMLVSVDWQMKLSGLVSGDLEYDGDDQGGSAKGSLAVNHGRFNVLPWLGKLTALVGLPDITDVEVDKETTDFAWKDHQLQLTHIDVRKNDVTRIAGEIDVDAQGQVDGKLKLGLPSSVTSKWPQMQAQIFPVQQDDFNWADVHLTGTADHLQEDLTSRMLAAGLNQGGDMLNQAAQKAGQLFNSFMGK